MNTTPKISIIVPVYNVEPYLSRCLNSILNQTFTEFECILVDDCSPDNCPSMCDEYARKDQRFRVIHNQQNQGSSLSRQIGIKQAVGYYVLFIDSDDWIEINMVEEMYAKAINENYDIVLCDSMDEQTGFYTNRPESDSTDKIARIKQLLSLEIHPSLPCQLVTRKLFLKVTFPQASCYEDWVITTQIIHYAEKVSFIPAVFYHSCSNPTSLTRNAQLEDKRTNEKYINYTLIVNFLREQYGDLSVFDPELSNFVNKAKLGIILNKRTRKNSKLLFELYPQSNQLIFNRKSRFPLYHKVFLFLATKNILLPLKLLDLFYVIRKKLKS